MSKFKYFSETEQLRFDAISREKYINDQASLERSAMLADRAEGRAEGERRKEAEMISKMRKSGLSEEQIKAILNS